MRFKCGETQAERMERERLYALKIKTERRWHRWWAWFPVTVAEGDCRWFETVECKRVSEGEASIWLSDWRYRALGDKGNGFRQRVDAF